jgi:hypothetical protein
VTSVGGASDHRSGQRWRSPSRQARRMPQRAITMPRGPMSQGISSNRRVCPSRYPRRRTSHPPSPSPSAIVRARTPEEPVRETELAPGDQTPAAPADGQPSGLVEVLEALADQTRQYPPGGDDALADEEPPEPRLGHPPQPDQAHAAGERDGHRGLTHASQGCRALRLEPAHPRRARAPAARPSPSSSISRASFRDSETAWMRGLALLITALPQNVYGPRLNAGLR